MKSPGLRNLGETHQGEQIPIDSIEFAQRNQLQSFWETQIVCHGMPIKYIPSHKHILEIIGNHFRRGPMVKGIRPRQAVERLKPNTQGKAQGEMERSIEQCQIFEWQSMKAKDGKSRSGTRVFFELKGSML